MAEQEGGVPDMVTFREGARRAVAEAIVRSMTHQRLSQLAGRDPAFPPTVKVGPARVVDWALLRAYLVAHQAKAAARDSRRRLDEGE